MTATVLDTNSNRWWCLERQIYWIARLSDLQTPDIVQPKKSIPSSSNSSASQNGYRINSSGPTICCIIEWKTDNIYTNTIAETNPENMQGKWKNVLWVPAIYLDKHNKIAKIITTAKQTAHQKTTSSSVFFDIFISRDRIVPVIGHYLPSFVINACHSNICVNLCTSFLSHLSQCFTNLAKATNWVPHSINELSGSQQTEDTRCIVWA